MKIRIKIIFLKESFIRQTWDSDVGSVERTAIRQLEAFPNGALYKGWHSPGPGAVREAGRPERRAMLETCFSLSWEAELENLQGL